MISSSFQREFDPQTGSVCQHSGCLCCERGGEAGRNPLINMEPLKLLSSSFWRGIDPNSGSVYPHSGCEYCYGVEGETPDNHGAIKVAFQWSSSFNRGTDTNSDFVNPNSGCLCWEGRVGGGEEKEQMINMGPLSCFQKVFGGRLTKKSG